MTSDNVREAREVFPIVGNGSAANFADFTPRMLSTDVPDPAPKASSVRGSAQSSPEQPNSEGESLDPLEVIAKMQREPLSAASPAVPVTAEKASSSKISAPSMPASYKSPSLGRPTPPVPE